jgi:hypothetical protein
VVLVVLETRGLEPDEQQRARIASCADVDQLEVWARRAVTAQTVDDLFR